MLLKRAGGGGVAAPSTPRLELRDPMVREKSGIHGFMNHHPARSVKVALQSVKSQECFFVAVCGNPELPLLGLISLLNVTQGKTMF